MTRKSGDTLVIEVEAPRACEFCGKQEETRPYGPGGKRICFGCAMDSPEMKAQTEANFRRLLGGADDA